MVTGFEVLKRYVWRLVLQKWCRKAHFRDEVEDLYPNKFVVLDERRMYVMNTLFNLPEIYILACIIDYFSSKCVDAVR